MFKTSKDYTIYEIKLLQIIKEARNTYTYVFTKPEGLTWEEGAHTHLALDRFDKDLGWWHKKDIRHFSIMSLSSEETLKMTTRLPEPHTDFKEALKNTSIGDVYYLFKVGSRLQLLRDNKAVVLLSAGVGIASLRPLLKAIELDREGITSVNHIHIDSSGEYLFESEFNRFTENIKSFRNKFTKNRQDFYKSLKEILENKELLNGQFYIIGSDDFILSIREFLAEYNINDNQLILDKKEEFYQLLNEKIS